MRLAAHVEGVGLVGPGLAGWEAAREVLAGRAAFAPAPTALPAPDMLPPTERRRAGKAVRVALATGLAAARDAGRDPATLAAVFASSSGDGDTCHANCETLASDDRSLSPTRFHNSVHNAPAGYWGIATGAATPADCVCAFDASFGAGLLEALARIATDPRVPVLLVAYDAPYPEPLRAARPVPDAFGVALVLSAAGAGARLAVATTPEPAPPPAGGALEDVRRTIPAARALPLLRLLARGAGGSAMIDYLDGLGLRVEVAP